MVNSLSLQQTINEDCSKAKFNSLLAAHRHSFYLAFGSHSGNSSLLALQAEPTETAHEQMQQTWVFNESTLRTFPSDALAAGEDSVVEAEGNIWKLASLGDLTISFWRYNRWWRNFETHASNESWDFTWKYIHYQESIQNITFLHIFYGLVYFHCGWKENKYLHHFLPWDDRCALLCQGLFYEPSFL